MKKEIACPLCGKKNFTVYMRKPDRRIVRCVNDGLVLVNPQPSGGELDRIYNENYFASRKQRTESSTGYYDYLSERPLLLPYFRRKIALLKKLLSGNRVLEIGSSYGFFLEEAMRAHFNISGIDISREAVSYARRRRLPARVADLFAAKFPPDTFDGVVAFHLIEHVPDPAAFMREVYRVTRPGGMVLLATPKEGGYLQTLMGKRWFSYRHREHLFFFSKQTMTMLLEKAGYSHIHCFSDETRWYPVHFLLHGAVYFFDNKWWQKVCRLGEAVFLVPPFSYIQIPFPLDTMIVTARKE